MSGKNNNHPDDEEISTEALNEERFVSTSCNRESISIVGGLWDYLPPSTRVKGASRKMMNVTEG